MSSLSAASTADSEGTYRREGAVRKERDRHSEEFKSLCPMHRRNPDPGDGPVIRAGLKNHSLDTGRPERLINTFDIVAARAEDADI